MNATAASSGLWPVVGRAQEELLVDQSIAGIEAALDELRAFFPGARIVLHSYGSLPGISPSPLVTSGKSHPEQAELSDCIGFDGLLSSTIDPRILIVDVSPDRVPPGALLAVCSRRELPNLGGEDLEALHCLGRCLARRLGDPASASSCLEVELEVSIELGRLLEDGVAGAFRSTPGGRFLWANRSMARLLGFEDPSELVQETENIAAEFYRDPSYRKKKLRRFEEHGFVDGEVFQLRRRDGSHLWVEGHTRAVRKEDGSIRYLEGTMVDVSDRVQAERKLKRSREQLQTVLDHAPIGIYLKDARGRYLVANRRFCNLVGLPEDRVVGALDQEIFEGEQAETLLAADELAVSSGGPIETELVLELPDRQRRDLLFTRVPLPNRERSGESCGIAIDLTRLHEYRDAAVSMANGEFHPDLQVHDGEQTSALGLALIDLGETLEQRFVEFSKLTEITEKVNAGLVLEEILESLYQSFKPVIPYDRIGVGLLEEETGLVVSRWARSDSHEILLQRGFSAPLKGSSLEAVLESGEPRILNDLERYLEEHPDSESTRLIVEEGLKSSLTCPLQALGKNIGFLFFSATKSHTYRKAHVGIYRRIAGQISTIVEKGRLWERLVELTETRRQFLGMAAHDLRNPVAVIRAYVELLLESQPSDEQLLMLREVEVASDRIRHLIDEILDARAIETGRLDLHLQRIPVEEPLRACLREYELMASGKEIHFDVDLAPDLPQILGDAHRIEQALGNLLSNALKFSEPGGRVEVRTRMSDRGVQITVRDFGPGIPKSEQKLIFREHQRGSALPTAGEPSSGLGLAIARRVVAAHGGTITVDSRPGFGATFAINLPATELMRESRNGEGFGIPDVSLCGSESGRSAQWQSVDKDSRG